LKAEELEILLVEDDSLDAESFRRAFVATIPKGKLTIASDANQALQLLEDSFSAIARQTPPVMLLDLNLPDVGGLELLAQIRSHSRFRPIQIFALTASNDPNDRQIAYFHNVSGYIVKPQTSDDYLHVMEVLRGFWEICEIG
jgi:CheY-like chemotaxis protein